MMKHSHVMKYWYGVHSRSCSMFHFIKANFGSVYLKDGFKTSSYKFYSNILGSNKMNLQNNQFTSGTCRRLLFYSPNSRLREIDRLNFSTYDRSVPRTVDEVEESLSKQSLSPSDSHLLKISIIGVPNSGKSTITNQLIKWRVCSISPKVHTTIKNARAVHNHDNIQLVFLDTPGIVTPEEIKKYKLRGSLIADPELSLQNTDLIAIIHDVSNKFTHGQLHPGILRLLALYPQKKSILILNKVDILKSKSKLLGMVKNLTEGKLGNKPINISKQDFERDLIHGEDVSRLDMKSDVNTQDENLSLRVTSSSEEKRDDIDGNSSSQLCEDEVLRGNLKLTEDQVNRFVVDKKGWPNFDEVFMVSALTGLGVNELRQFLLYSANPSPWMFTGDTVTDQTPQEMAMNTVREKCLKHLTHNVGYELKFGFLHWELSESEVLSILINISCSTPSRMKLLIGKSGKVVQAIAQEAEQELRDTFRTEVRLRLNIESERVEKKSGSAHKGHSRKNKRIQH